MNDRVWTGRDSSVMAVDPDIISRGRLGFVRNDVAGLMWKADGRGKLYYEEGSFGNYVFSYWE